MKKTLLLTYAFASLVSGPSSWAYPDLTKPVGTDGMPLKVFKDHDNDSLYWYIPTSIEPWSRNEDYKSVLYRDDSALTFIFRGQASVDEDMLKQIAKANHTDVSNFTPIFYDYSRDLVCQNIYADNSNVSWLFPKAIGNFLEVVPVSIRVKNEKPLMDEVESLVRNGGLACTVGVGFKAYTMAYKAHYEFDLNQVYNRFEAAAHAEGFWFEVDIHTVLQSMQQEGMFTFHLDEDTSIPQTVMDQKMAAAFEDLEKQIITLVFTAAPRIPSGGLANRGKPFSLRTDYVRSSFKAHYRLDLSSDKIKVQDSQIGLRIGVK